MNELLQITGGTAIPRVVNYHVPVFILLIIACVLLLFVYLLYHKKTLQLVQGIFSYSSAKQLQREGYSFFKFFSVALSGVYIICGAIFFSYLNERNGWVCLPDNKWILPLSVLFLGVVMLIKKLSVELLTLFLRNRKALSDYFFQYSFSVKTEGLLLLPVCLLLYYSSVPAPWLIGIGLGVPALIFMMRVVRAIAWSGSEHGVSVFHIVLYLCTVEIIPLAVFIKVLAAGWLQFG